MYHVSQEFHEKITAPERRVLGKVEIEYWREYTTIKHYEPSVVFVGEWILDYHNADHHSNVVGDRTVAAVSFADGQITHWKDLKFSLVEQ